MYALLIRYRLNVLTYHIQYEIYFYRGDFEPFARKLGKYGDKIKSQKFKVNEISSTCSWLEVRVLKVQYLNKYSVAFSHSVGWQDTHQPVPNKNLWQTTFLNEEKQTHASVCECVCAENSRKGSLNVDWTRKKSVWEEKTNQEILPPISPRHSILYMHIDLPFYRWRKEWIQCHSVLYVSTFHAYLFFCHFLNKSILQFYGRLESNYVVWIWSREANLMTPSCGFYSISEMLTFQQHFQYEQLYDRSTSWCS